MRYMTNGISQTSVPAMLQHMACGKNKYKDSVLQYYACPLSWGKVSTFQTEMFTSTEEKNDNECLKPVYL